ncbi:hypothetical protein ASPWEDRAFT_548578 [Aspergillus wentii DTO 134E9]|uniref:DUF7770 domain-containing protein n=1 Tax=Aspergillus wentii DTO 134E9 TaxID=1073089 RepID=A0A1L9RG43_ASPWE|nr:uncharacterized protein ASPWEDRAFT_548578 [Aspergillus wentii DTO 134E9]OJJ33890.1 hypothetical protein ASPWEDRAFT_548578 [Aspergillus wentii DTO 134E9]
MFQITYFIPKHHQSQILALPVQKIIAAAHEKIQDKTTPTNHWCFYILTSPGHSVQLDCQPSYSIPSIHLPGGSKANIIISELDCEVPSTAQGEARFYLDIRAGLTVGDVYDRLVENGRHKYEFDSDGVGCRYWVIDQIQLLYRDGIVVDEGQVLRVKEAVCMLWPDRTVLELDQGVYYE